MPPTDQPSAEATAVLATVSVVRIASAASAPPSRLSAAAACALPEQPVHRQALADQPGRADRDGRRAGPERVGDGLRGAVGVGEAVRAGARVAPPELRTTAST
jgi:hypothetical protein